MCIHMCVLYHYTENPIIINQYGLAKTFIVVCSHGKYENSMGTAAIVCCNEGYTVLGVNIIRFHCMTICSHIVLQPSVHC